MLAGHATSLIPWRKPLKSRLNIFHFFFLSCGWIYKKGAYPASHRRFRVFRYFLRTPYIIQFMSSGCSSICSFFGLRSNIFLNHVHETILGLSVESDSWTFSNTTCQLLSSEPFLRKKKKKKRKRNKHFPSPITGCCDRYGGSLDLPETIAVDWWPRYLTWT